MSKHPPILVYTPSKNQELHSLSSCSQWLISKTISNRWVIFPAWIMLILWRSSIIGQLSIPQAWSHSINLTSLLWKTHREEISLITFLSMGEWMRRWWEHTLNRLFKLLIPSIKWNLQSFILICWLQTSSWTLRGKSRFVGGPKLPTRVKLSNYQNRSLRVDKYWFAWSRPSCLSIKRIIQQTLSLNL